jgi:hypothetical protein
MGSIMIGMFEGKYKFRGIMRNKIAELQQLKGRKKAPSKRYIPPHKVDDDPIIKSSLLSEETKPSEIEMTCM